MKTFALTFFASVAFSLAVSAQEKAAAPVSRSADVVKNEATQQPSNDSESVKVPASSNASTGLRSDAPTGRIERTPEMLEKKKTAPLLSDPQ